ncbi:hypothetical protein EYF80_010588 [Liparis tanakae]|uniref:Uncharacterized protein n=1 Tax=Liparis tanakae TaxID=230148 RepID=A0A4Z2IM65_9TELE|nr:hypothetical protein EYF80_010588 [Liparis tanakae]
MNLAAFNIQDRGSFFKHVQRWAVRWASGYDNTLTCRRAHIKAPSEGYKAAAGCCRAAAKSCFKSAGRRSDGLQVAAAVSIGAAPGATAWPASLLTAFITAAYANIFIVNTELRRM